MPKKTDGTEWLYVLEINPGKRIKVGRTTDVRARLLSHTANASFGGGEITQIYTALCPESRAAEFALIAQLAARPGVQVVLGRELFEGIRFRAAVELAESISDGFRRKPAEAAAAQPGQLMSDCAAAFGGDERLHLGDLRDRLAKADPDLYTHLTVLTLGSILRDFGVRTRSIRIGNLVRRGIYALDFTALRPAETGDTG